VFPVTLFEGWVTRQADIDIFLKAIAARNIRKGSQGRVWLGKENSWLGLRRKVYVYAGECFQTLE
jgi:hypothetical protein